MKKYLSLFLTKPAYICGHSYFLHIEIRNIFSTVFVLSAGYPVIRSAGYLVQPYLPLVRSWVPFELTLYLASDGTVHTNNSKANIDFVQSQTYQLYAGIYILSNYS